MWDGHNRPEKPDARNIRHLYLSQPEKSFVTKHFMDAAHNTKFNNTCRLSTATSQFGSRSERSYSKLVTYRSQ
jgi:hypothetical protein